MEIKLSICIPTYNRANYIVETIDSIASQLNNEIEIVVSDNASNDGTEKIIRSYQSKISNIKYFCWSKNVGADLNYLKVIELARGKYCWFIGSDDTLKPYAIKRMLQEINLGHDIYLCSRTLCDVSLNPIKDQSFVSTKSDLTFQFYCENDIIMYLKKSLGLGALFSYISSITFLRERWNNVHCDNSFINSAYSHVYMLISVIKKGCVLKYINDPLVNCRTNNDSFLENGHLKRVMIDINGYLMIADHFFCQHNQLRDHFLKVLRRERNWKSAINIRRRAPKRDWKDLSVKLERIGFNHIVILLISMGSPFFWNLIYYLLSNLKLIPKIEHVALRTLLRNK